MLNVKEIADKSVWEAFLLNAEGMYPLFQSWNWGEVQKALGVGISRYGLYEEKKLVAVNLFTNVQARRGNYLHVRHGPVFHRFNTRQFDFLMDHIKKIAKETRASFIRVSPLIKDVVLEKDFFKKRGFHAAPIHNMDAEICWVLDIQKSQDVLLSEMRKSHRYLIKKAQSFGIEIIKSVDPKDIHQFLSIYKELSEKKHFIPHRGLSEEFGIFSKDNQAMLFLARFQKKIIGGALILFVKDMAIYHHAASLSSFRNIPSSYLLQWETIKEAKNRGLKVYNFWGIAPENVSARHPWVGLSLFKKGFGGRAEQFVHAQDLPITFMYWKTFGIELLTKLRKGY